MEKKRGVIMLPHLDLTPSKRTARGTSPSSMLLRKMAVYWDEIEVPCNDLIDWALPRTGDIVELLTAGVLKETLVYVASEHRPVPSTVPSLNPSTEQEDVSAFLVRTQWALFDHNERINRGSSDDRSECRRAGHCGSGIGASRRGRGGTP